MLLAGANTREDPEKNEILDLMHSAEFRSFPSSDAQISFFRDKRHCFKWNTIARAFKSPNRPCADG
jgi:hypothetical protein